ncbi:MAG: SAF domain-containing protein [Leptospirillum sp.]
MALAAMIFLIANTSRPKAYQVYTVTAEIPVGSVITSNNLGTISVMGGVPSGAIPSTQSVIGQYAQTTLYPGQMLVSQDVASTFGGTPAGDVSLMMPVTAAQSALVGPGQYVDVMGFVAGAASGAAPNVVPLATHILVLNTYTSGGAAMTGTPATSAPGMVELAVTPAEAETLLPFMSNASDYWLVLDPHRVIP